WSIARHRTHRPFSPAAGGAPATGRPAWQVGKPTLKDGGPPPVRRCRTGGGLGEGQSVHWEITGSRPARGGGSARRAGEGGGELAGARAEEAERGGAAGRHVAVPAHVP